jgi:hypothetical protein
VRSEMREEAAEASPGFSTPEMARSVLFWTVIAALVGAAVAVPVGIIDTGNLPMATRLLIVALVGAAIGGTIGFFFAATTGVGFFGRHRTGHSDLAAERAWPWVQRKALARWLRRSLTRTPSGSTGWRPAGSPRTPWPRRGGGVAGAERRTTSERGGHRPHLRPVGPHHDEVGVFGIGHGNESGRRSRLSVTYTRVA